jgi:putative membrane protein
MRAVIAVAGLGIAPAAWAHVGGEVVRGGFEPWVGVLLAISGIAYAVGLARLWARAAPGHGIARRGATAFGAGWLTLVVALAPPLDSWAARSFAAHMLQHEALMLVAAPLLVAGRPLAVFAWAFPRTVRPRLATLTHASMVRAMWGAITGIGGATVLQLAALFAWHVPRFFDVAATHRGWHALQHATFLATALAFWWAVRTASSDGARARAVVALFATMLATGALGALLTFATTPWYATLGAPPFGGSALDDQQLGGLLMWVPGGTAFLVAALALARRLLQRGAASFPIVAGPRA